MFKIPSVRKSVEVGQCLTLWFDYKIDQWHLLHEAVTGGGFTVTIECCANKTATNFQNADPGWWGKVIGGSGMDKPLLDIISSLHS